MLLETLSKLDHIQNTVHSRYTCLDMDQRTHLLA